MRLSFTEMAIAQKLDFQSFVDEWLEKHDIWYFKRQIIVEAINRAGWGFFIDELVEYYQYNPELYRVYDDTVKLLDY